MNQQVNIAILRALRQSAKAITVGVLTPKIAAPVQVKPGCPQKTPCPKLARRVVGYGR